MLAQRASVNRRRSDTSLRCNSIAILTVTDTEDVTTVLSLYSTRSWISVISLLYNCLTNNFSILSTPVQPFSAVLWLLTHLLYV